MSKTFKFILPAAITLTLALAFCFVQPVFAQDELPPTETPLEETLTETPLEPPVETPTDLPPEEPAVEEPVEPPAEGEPLEEAPAEIVLLEEAGEPLSMASQEAAEVLGGDPYFTCSSDTVDGTVDGVCHYNGINGLRDAINSFVARGGSGMIRVEALVGGYNGDAVNGFLIQPANSAGLTGIIRVGTTDLVHLNHWVTISNMGSFTLTGFILDNISYNGALVTALNNTGTLTLDSLQLNNTHGNGDAIYITGQTGAVNIIDVEADMNLDRGAQITASGNVTITNSSFDYNSTVSPALEVTSTAGNITLNAVTASQNMAGPGALVLAKTGLTIRNSLFYANSGYGLSTDPANRGAILIENTRSNNNSSDGIDITTLSGAVTLTNVQVNSNSNGATIDTCQYSGSACIGTGAVTVNTSEFLSNGFSNLYVEANGAITLNTVDGRYTSLASGRGAWLLNERGASASAITINHGLFSSQTGANAWGLYIQSKGTVTLNHVRANGMTNGSGIYINNTFGTGAVSMLATLGANEVYGNQGAQGGLYILSKGTVTINNITVNNNTGPSIYIDNTSGTAGVTITTAVTSSSANGPCVDIRSNGLISLTGVIASGSAGGTGMTLINSTSPGKAGVTIKDSTADSNFSTNVSISTLGLVTITNLHASESVFGAGLYINAGSNAVNVTNGTFDGDHTYGLYITSDGAITLKDIHTALNILPGVILDNTTPTTSSPAVSITNLTSYQNGSFGLDVVSDGQITLTTFNIRENSTMEGIRLNSIAGGVAVNSIGSKSQVYTHTGANLQINAVGAVTINNIEATGSTAGQGIYVVTTGAVTISNSYIYGNNLDGIRVDTAGNITLNNVDSNNSATGYGARLDNNPGTGSITISGGSISDFNTFNFNYLGGVHVDTNGAVTFSNVQAYANRNSNPGTSGEGINIGGNAGNVTMTNINVNIHPLVGILINNIGTVTLTTISVDNTHSGTSLYINNTTPTTSSPAVTITGLTLRNGGTTLSGHGLYVLSDGAITVRNFTLNNHPTGYSMHLNNTNGTAGVTLSGASAVLPSTSEGGLLAGINILTNGPVSLTHVWEYTAHGSTTGGIVIDNTGGTGSVTLSDVRAISNDNHGIYIQTKGTVSLSTVTTSSNGSTSLTGNGLRIINTGTSTISITDATANYNYAGNLHVTGNRQITLTRIYAYTSAAGYGIYADNHTGTGGVSLIGTTAVRNDIEFSQLDNIYILTNGDVTMQNTYTRSSQTGDGVEIDNYNMGSGTGKVTITNLTTEYNYNGNGLTVGSNGVISVSGSTAKMNDHGMFLDNDNSSTTPAAISISSSSSLNNSQNGFRLLTRGNTTLSQLTATSNGWQGAYIDYNDAAITAVTNVSRSTFYSNGSHNIYIEDGGNVTLATVSSTGAYGAPGDGVCIDNSGGGSVGSVSVLATYGANTFSENGGSGLYIQTNGAVTLNSVTVNKNNDYGVYIDNHTGSGVVTMTGGTINQNTWEGIYIYSSNVVTLSNLQVFDNGMGGDHAGISIITTSDAATIQNSQISGNGKWGIYANLTAVLTVKKCSYYGNNQYSPSDNNPNIFVEPTSTLVIIR